MTNDAKIRKVVQELQEATKTRAISFVSASQNVLVTSIKNVIRKRVNPDYSTGKLEQSIRPTKVKVLKTKVRGGVISDKRIARYGKYVSAGRKPGNFPSIKHILQRINDSGKFEHLTKKQKKSLAYLMARKIYKDGVKPFPFMELGLKKARFKLKFLAFKYGFKL